MNLESRVEEVAARMGGTLAVAAHHLGDGRTFLRLEERRFPSASVIKVAILVALARAWDRGEVAPDERRPLRADEKVDGSGVLRLMGPGLTPTLEDLAWLMITVSDNTASNMLIDRLGCDAVNREMEELGLQVIRLGRKFYDFEARARGLDNWIAAGEMTHLLTMIERGEAAGPERSTWILEVLKAQQFTSRIPALLPEGVVVAHKTGSITGISHDAGLIYANSGPIALAVLTEGADTPVAAETGIREVARIVYEQWSGG